MWGRASAANPAAHRPATGRRDRRRSPLDRGIALRQAKLREGMSRAVRLHGHAGPIRPSPARGCVRRGGGRPARDRRACAGVGFDDCTRDHGDRRICNSTSARGRRRDGSGCALGRVGRRHSAQLTNWRFRRPRPHCSAGPARPTSTWATSPGATAGSFQRKGGCRSVSCCRRGGETRSSCSAVATSSGWGWRARP